MGSYAKCLPHARGMQEVVQRGQSPPPLREPINREQAPPLTSLGALGKAGSKGALVSEHWKFGAS